LKALNKVDLVLSLSASSSLPCRASNAHQYMYRQKAFNTLVHVFMTACDPVEVRLR